MNFRNYNDGSVGISIDETTTEGDIISILDIFSAEKSDSLETSIPSTLQRTSAILQNPVFHQYRSETDMLLYMHKLDIPLLEKSSEIGKMYGFEEYKGSPFPNTTYRDRTEVPLKLSSLTIIISAVLFFKVVKLN